MTEERQKSGGTGQGGSSDEDEEEASEEDLDLYYITEEDAKELNRLQKSAEELAANYLDNLGKRRLHLMQRNTKKIPGHAESPGEYRDS